MGSFATLVSFTEWARQATLVQWAPSCYTLRLRTPHTKSFFRVLHVSLPLQGPGAGNSLSLSLLLEAHWLEFASCWLPLLGH
ncbi:hypothetical protein EV356DRAFT_508752 [Viridothelium virens]|uniref:Uncharacterized protein n=1 Tax=Viridothelium virens TaxID=1048519 RepID=A0A6A6HIZ5_VIRVR|nr:hypothetical protein EV356DRAFT_508752 [Viridothelium virens]